MTDYDVLLIGRTPLAAVLARQLAEERRSVAVIDDGMTPSVTDTVEWLTLRHLGLGNSIDFSTWPVITQRTDLQLLDDGSVEQTYRSASLSDKASRTLVPTSSALSNTLLASSNLIDQGAATPSRLLYARGIVTGVEFADGAVIAARLTIITSENRRLPGATIQAMPGTTAPPLVEQIEVAWSLDSIGAVGEAARTVISGGPLAEVKGCATLFSLPNRLVLSLTLAVDELVREAVVITDVLAQLLGHPALGDLPSLVSADAASTRLLSHHEANYMARYGPGYAVFGPLWRMTQPASFDRELSFALRLGSYLGAAPPERLGQVSLMAEVVAQIRYQTTEV